MSGRPISFVEDLYQPLYIPRPVVVPELYASLRPPVDYGGIATAGEAATAEPAELTAEVADGPQSKIIDEVHNGVPTRMAILARALGKAR